MDNIVIEMDALRMALNTECALRAETQKEFDNGEQHGVFRSAHDQCILTVLSAAQALVNKAAE